MKKKNLFESVREVKWCPGCGNYAILKSMQITLNDMGIENNKIVFVSGIGCSGRFPYYINTYGFHTLHGRAPAIITGLSLSRPDLLLWLVIGDGDAFSIGLNHLIHMIRRNVNINVLFINNKVYALTKGQYSPTSDIDFRTKSSPFGGNENPINPLEIVLSSGCTFVARFVDNDFKNSSDIIKKAINHKGTSFIEVMQNCNVFNNKIYDNISDNEKKKERNLYLENNSYLKFGFKKKYYLYLKNNLNLEIISIKDPNLNYPIFNSTDFNILQILLSKFSYNDIPFPLGIFRSISKLTYYDLIKSKFNFSKKIKNYDSLFF